MRGVSPKLIVVLFTASLLISVSIYLQTNHFKESLRAAVNERINSAIDQEFNIGSIEGSIIFGITLKDVKLITEEKTFISIEEISTQYYLPLLLSFFISGDIPLKNARIRGAEVNIIRNENGIWNFRKIKKKKKKNDEKRVVSIYLNGASISGSKLVIDDALRSRYLSFLLYDSRFSIDLIRLNTKSRQIVVDAHDLNVDFNKLGELKFRNLKTNATITRQGVSFKDLKGLINGLDVKSSGAVNNYRSPEVAAEVFLNKYRAEGIGTFNVSINAEGRVYKLSNIVAEADVNFVDSTIRGHKLQTSFKKIRMNGTRMNIKGNIDYKLGRSSIDGYIDLKKLLAKQGTNEYYFESGLDDLLVKDLLKAAGIKSDLLATGSSLKADGTFTVQGSWSESSDFTANFNVSDLNLGINGQSSLTANGKVQAFTDHLSFNLQTRSDEFPFSALLAKIDSSAVLSSELNISGDIPYKETRNNFALTVKGIFDNSAVNGLSVIRGSIDSVYDRRNLKKLLLDVSSNYFSFKINGAGDLDKKIELFFNASSEDTSFLNLYYKKVKAGGAIKLNGTLTGSVQNPKMNLSADVTRMIYNNKLFIKEGRINLSTELWKNKGLDFDINSDLYEIRYNNINLKNLRLIAKTFNQEDIKVNLNGKFSDTEKLLSDFVVYNFADSRKKIEINTLELNLGEQLLSSAEKSTISLDPDKVHIDSLMLKNGKSEIYGDGYLNYNSSKKSRLLIRTKNLDLSAVSRILPNDLNVQGYADLDLDLNGPLKSPLISLTGSSDNISINEQGSFSPVIKIKGSKNKTEFDLRNTDQDGFLSAMSGTVQSPVNFYELSRLMESRLDLKMKLSKINIYPLRLLRPEIKKLAGNLTADLLVTGSVLKPRLNGTSELDNFSILIPPLKNKINLKNASIDFKDNRAVLSETTLTSNAGKAKISALADLDDFTYQTDISLDKLYLRHSLFETNLDGAVALKGKKSKINLQGRLKLNDFNIEMKNQREEQVYSDITFVDADITEYKTIKKNGNYYRDNVAADLELNIPDNTWLSQRNARVALKGALRINKKFGDGHVISGTVDTKKGNYTAFGRLFSIKKGFINFPSIRELNPQVNLSAQYEIKDKDILINIVGEAKDLKINLSSSPPMNKEDIVSYLIFGSSSVRLGSNQRHLSQEIASSIAMEEFAELILPQLGLDLHVVSIQSSKQTGFSQPQVTVGSFVNDRLYLGYERNLSGATDPTASLQNKIKIEYDINDSFLLNSIIGGSNTGADIFYHFDF